MILPRQIENWPELYREAYEERAAIIEYLGNKPKLEAEFLAEDCVRRMAKEEELDWESIT